MQWVTSLPRTVFGVVGRQKWALVSMCVCIGIASIDNSILNVALATISSDIGASNSELQWIVDTYALMFASLMLTMGSLGDRYGRRRVLRCGLTLFGVGSAVAALSSSAVALIACRATMGVGAACISTATLGLMSNVFTDPREHTKAIGAWAATGSVGLAAGPVVGGLLLQHFWWGSVFLVNVPIVVALIIGSRWTLPESKNPESAFLDPLGVVLSVTALAVLLWGVIEGATRGWGDPLIVAALVTAALLVGLFITWELHTPRPMVNLRLFSDARFSGATAVSAISMFIGGGTLFVLGQLLQFGLGLSALQAGLRMAPMAVTMASASVFSARWIRKRGNRYVIAVGLMLNTLSAAMWLTITPRASFTTILPIMLVYGLGQGLVFAPCMAAAMGVAPRQRAGAASGAINTLRQVGLALGVAVLGSALNSSFSHGLRSRSGGLALTPSQLDEASTSTGDAFRLARDLDGDLGAKLADAAQRAFVHAGIVTMMVTVVVGLVGLVVNQCTVPAHVVADHDELVVWVPAE
jgi:EmrB/QacA subfamily drug resistance transporter